MPNSSNSYHIQFFNRQPHRQSHATIKPTSLCANKLGQHMALVNRGRLLNTWPHILDEHLGFLPPHFYLQADPKFRYRMLYVQNVWGLMCFSCWLAPQAILFQFIDTLSVERWLRSRHIGASMQDCYKITSTDSNMKLLATWSSVFKMGIISIAKQYFLKATNWTASI